MKGWLLKIAINFSSLLLLLFFGFTTGCTNKKSIPYSRVILLNTNNLQVSGDSTVIISLNSLINTNVLNTKKALVVIDLNTGDSSNAIWYDSNNDNNVDAFGLKFWMDSLEPVRPFKLFSKLEKSVDIIAEIPAHAIQFKEVIPLISAKDYLQNNPKQNSWAEIIANSVMKTYPNAADLELYSQGLWSYTNGFFINGLYTLSQLNTNPDYLNYVKSWYANSIDSLGKFKTNKFFSEKQELDDILPGRALLDISNDEKITIYKPVIDHLVEQMKQQPVTTEGGYWHKKVYEWQMWLDGIYMADLFLLQYAVEQGNDELLQKGIQQFKLIHDHLLDTTTGLYYHGWDESKNNIWSNHETGTSPTFWGRGMGWWGMAMVDALDYIPKENPFHDTLVYWLRDFSKSIVKYQSTNGLWYQVTDKPNEVGNWPEASCTAMFAYMLAKASNKGYVPKEYFDRAQLAFDGLLNEFLYFDNNENLYLTGTVKVGTLNYKHSDGSFNYYISVERRVNDFKGIAALMYLSMELKN